MSGGKTFQSTVIANPYDPEVKGMVYQVYIVGGSVDSHNKGYFTTPTALSTAYPTGEVGDWAIVGSTDTVWIWDDSTSSWKDGDTKGQVTSVNNKTGAVILTAKDLSAVPQANVMPEAADSLEDTIMQYKGATGSGFVNGYFYKCVSDGAETPTYSWAQLNVQPLPPDELPTQSGNNGKFLTTNGSTVSWADVDKFPDQTGKNGKFLRTNGATVAWEDVPSELPSQSGNSGKFLTTNGSTVSWIALDVFPSQAGNAGKVLTTNGTAVSWQAPTTITFRTWGANE